MASSERERLNTAGDFTPSVRVPGPLGERPRGGTKEATDKHKRLHGAKPARNIYTA